MANAMTLEKAEAYALTPEQALVRRVMRRYRAGVQDKRSRGLYEQWAEYQRFWEADQWPAPTPKTKNLPRPVTNYFAHVIEAKVSALTYEMPEIYFEPAETGIGTVSAQRDDDDETRFDIEAAELLSEVARHLSEAEHMELPHLLEEGLRTAAMMGTCIWFFPWDNTISGGTPGRSKFVGDIRGMEIDPADFFPGNPHDPNIQSQPYILVTERLPLATVRELYRDDADPAVLAALQPERQQSDSVVYDHQRIEQDETEYVTVIHHWWKEADDKGNVSLNYAAICQDKLLRQEDGIYDHGLYPFVAMQWYPRRKSFWGKPESADLIHNQKERNRMEGMGLLNIYAHGAPKPVYKRGAIDPRQLDNNPFNPVEDRYTGQGWGVHYLNPPQFPVGITQMIAILTDGLKDATRAHDAFVGKAPSAELNASAIIALQEAAGITIRPIQRRLHRAMRDMGRLWLAHWKENYTESRLIRIVGPDNRRAFVWFKGTDFKSMAFDVRVKATAASPFGRTLYMATLDGLFERRIIDAQMYLDMLPADVFPQIGRLRHLMEQRRQAEAEAQARAAQPPPAPAQPPPEVEGLLAGLDPDVAMLLQAAASPGAPPLEPGFRSP